MSEKANKIETVDALTAAFPELVQQIQDRAVESSKPKIEADARKAEQDRILDLIGIQFDEGQSAKLKSVIESGVSADQFKAIKDLEGETKPQDNDEDEARRKALEAIAGAGAENPGAGDGSGQQKDYMILVEEYMATHQVPRLNAMQAINRMHPKAREDYIARANQHAKTG